MALKNPEFWQKMDRASEEARKWPEWMKGSPVNRREPLPELNAITDVVLAYKPKPKTKAAKRRERRRKRDEKRVRESSI